MLTIRPDTPRVAQFKAGIEDPRVTRMRRLYRDTLRIAHERAIEDVQHSRCSVNGAIFGLRREYKSAWQSFLDGVGRISGGVS